MRHTSSTPQQAQSRMTGARPELQKLREAFLANCKKEPRDAGNKRFITGAGAGVFFDRVVELQGVRGGAFHLRNLGGLAESPLGQCLAETARAFRKGSRGC